MLTQRAALQLRKKLHASIDVRLPALFSVLGDPCRFKIFKLLKEERGNLCVTDFASVCDISVPAASQQLKIMEMAQVVKRERCGQKICYQLNDDDEVINQVSKLII